MFPTYRDRGNVFSTQTIKSGKFWWKINVSVSMRIKYTKQASRLVCFLRISSVTLDDFWNVKINLETPRTSDTEPHSHVLQ
jgi:hypothetical protein